MLCNAAADDVLPIDKLKLIRSADVFLNIFSLLTIVQRGISMIHTPMEFMMPALLGWFFRQIFEIIFIFFSLWPGRLRQFLFFFHWIIVVDVELKDKKLKMSLLIPYRMIPLCILWRNVLAVLLCEILMGIK